MSKYLCLWLEADLQSWGNESKFSRKETLSFPTKSGVLGIVLASMGKQGPQTELLSDLNCLDMQVKAYCSPAVSYSTNTDFHMVGSGYDSSDGFQALFIPKRADGKSAIGGGAKLTYRSYLQDICFAVLLEVPDALFNDVATALSAPIYDSFLGRKACVPTEFIFQGCFDDLHGAITKAVDIAAIKDKVQVFSVIQTDDGDPTADMSVNDVPLSFGKEKKYASRHIKILKL